MTQPPMPQNVRLQDKDTGEVFPVELVYEGWDPEEGIHRWVAVPTSRPWSRNMRVLIDVLPPKTGVAFRWDVDS